jgi:hypothetical protein
VYDITKDTSRTGGAAAPGQQQPQGLGQQQPGNSQPGMQPSPQQITPPPYPPK